MYAGLAGVLLALAFGRIVPESFGFLLSIEFLAMIVIGGLGSVGGAIAGAVLVSALPQVLERYSELAAARLRGRRRRPGGRRRPPASSTPRPSSPSSSTPRTGWPGSRAGSRSGARPAPPVIRSKESTA